MKTYLQYFNVEKMGRLPNAADALFTQRMGVFTKLASAQEAKGSTVFVITGLGKPKQYYLWESFTIEEVTKEGEQFVVSGPGWVLLPPQSLNGKDFEKFKNACANFVTFRAIDDLPYTEILRKIANKLKLDKPTKACEKFCNELIEMLPKMGDAYYYRATVRRRLDNAEGAKDDFTQAVKLGTNFSKESQAAMTGKSTKPAATAAAPARLSGQVVSKGVFASSARKPARVSDVAWQAVLLRRGPEELRQQLLKAYSGKCAITGADAEPALEAAVIHDSDDAPRDATNAILLRGDVRTLFELNLLRIHPKTRKIFLTPELKKGKYARLAARQLALPTKTDWQPSEESLAKRWQAAGGSPEE